MWSLGGRSRRLVMRLPLVLLRCTDVGWRFALVVDGERRIGGDLVRRLRAWGDLRMLMLERCDDVRATAPADATLAGGRRRCRFRNRRRGGRSAAARRHRGRGLLLGARALLTLPARADSRHLVVGEQTQMAANRNVHLTKERDHIVRRDSEFTSHVVYAKLAQALLLRITRGARLC